MMADPLLLEQTTVVAEQLDQVMVAAFFVQKQAAEVVKHMQAMMMDLYSLHTLSRDHRIVPLVMPHDNYDRVLPRTLHITCQLVHGVRLWRPRHCS